MARVTITLPDELHRALKAAAATRGTTIGNLVAESLDFYGIKTAESSAALVARSRERAAMSENEAVNLAVEETTAERSQ